MERNLCLIQRGPSYQFSPETMSSLPSPLMSATVQVSFAPRSIKCFSKGMSSVRPMVQATEAHSASTAAAIGREPMVNSLQWTIFARLSGPDHDRRLLSTIPNGSPLPVMSLVPGICPDFRQARRGASGKVGRLLGMLTDRSDIQQPKHKS